ncbi:MAG: ImmA/IrrE family metallo-endopeptidase [Dehalococcoidia bacterium]
MLRGLEAYILGPERKHQIETRARALRWEIFDQSEQFWPGRKPRGLEVADPEIAATVLGVTFQYHQQLSFALADGRYRSAGLLDRRRAIIMVAEEFGLQVARFTAAHELGHWLLHDRLLQHRDAPIRGIERNARDLQEREADYFAACFLMPRDYLIKMFFTRFPSDGPLEINDTSAYYLRPFETELLLYPPENSLVREKALAMATSFGGRHFDSLAAMFKVSVETMAIRIRELGLVKR